MLSDAEIIKSLKIKKTDKVLDIGGSMKQHDLIRVNVLADIIPPDEAPYTSTKLKAEKFVKVDITTSKLPFKNKSFDVCLCTHTLEDLYNPFLVISEMERVAKRGVIVTPSMGKDMVFSKIDETDWLTGSRRVPGQSHHKWFFETRKGIMIITPKNYGILYTPNFHLVDWLGEDEFIFYWKNKIDFKVIDELNIHSLIDYYQNFLTRNKDKVKIGNVLSYHDSVANILKAKAKKILRKGEGFKYRNPKYV